jgi:hypothetical protein
MMYIPQLVYILDGREKIFNEFETIVIPIISNYNGRLMTRIRPTDDSIIDCNIEKPYEIHLVEFNSHEDFEDYQKDKVRTKFLHLKKKSIKSTMLIEGTEL